MDTFAGLRASKATGHAHRSREIKMQGTSQQTESLMRPVYAVRTQITKRLGLARIFPFTCVHDAERSAPEASVLMSYQ